jgi:plexin A
MINERNMQAVLLLVLLAFKLATYGSFSYSHGGNVVQASWEDATGDEKLLHMTIDEQTGQRRVYIGAVNKIYQLSSDLKLEAQAQMGPALDNYECPVTRNCPNIELKLMNYYNKALVIYTPNYTPTTIASSLMQPQASTLPFPTPSPLTSSNSYYPSPLSSSTQNNNFFNAPNQQALHIQQQYNNNRPISWLISCGTLYQGICALHNLDNITNYEIPANESVVANSPYASTVAFIAPGPTKSISNRQQPVLYVGASYTGLGPYNTEVPAVSSRSLHQDSMFNFASSNVASGTRLTVNSLSRDRFPITYVHGFASKGFSYFVTVQKKTNDSPKPFITKLARVCHKDVNYHSYVEVQLSCHTNEIDYNLAQAAYVGKPGQNLADSLRITTSDEVLYVAFAKSTDKRDIYNEPSQQSALCIYSIPHILASFTQNIQYCHHGQGEQGLDFINPTESCIATQVQITDDFCGSDVNNLINGHFPIEALPVITYNNVSITAVAASPTNDFTVAYLGTSNGQLRRLVIEDATTAIEYSNSIVDPQRRTPINADMRFDRRDTTANFIYVMNDKKISLIKTQECNQYKTCAECLGAHDPHCGWCSLENRCSIKSSCAEANQDSLYWLSYRSGKCTTITSVSPPQIQKTTTRTLSLNIENLPSVEGPFLCGFTTQGRTEFTNASRSLAGVTCPTPSTEILPPLAPSSHDLVTKLSVRMANGPDFTATNFTFFDCSSYSTCTDCVSSPYPCDWCVDNHRCTHDTGDHCRNDILVNGIKQRGPSVRLGPKHCPRINTTHGSSEILVSAGRPRRIQVQVHEIPERILQAKFSCQINIEGRVRQVEAKLLGDVVYCDPMEFAYSSPAPNISASFAVIWDNSKPLDNPYGIHVLVYQCSAMADNCGFCLELPERYACGWCKGSSSCQIQEHCTQVTHQPSFLISSDTCPNPQIISFEPTSGPYEGGTNLTIKGINLGRTFEDIQNGVTVELLNGDIKTDQIECIPFRELYIRTSQITCQLASPVNSTIQTALAGSSLTGIISIRVTNTDYVTRSQDKFSFVNPKILSIIPSKGPKSGGTKLVLWGLDMSAGSRAEAFVGEAPCIITSRQTDRAECITSPVERPGVQKVSVRFDNGERIFHDYNFLYVEDPEVDVVTSSLAATSHHNRPGFIYPPPKGIPAGGITVHVKGKNFISIQEPRFYVVADGTKYNGSCQVENATDMSCLSPFVPEERVNPYRLSPEEPLELDYGFFMDNVEGVHNLATRRGNRLPMFLMYSNPEYKPFPEEIKYYKSDYLTINGSNLDRASSEYDITVRIGNGFCNVTSLSRTQLTCKPPLAQPEALNWRGQPDSAQLPDVVVTVGNSLNFTIGKISYESYEGLERIFSKPVLFVMVISACFLMLVVVAILIAYRRKASESNRVVKTMQEQMDVLEMKVASEAKQAFTELQTEMTDLTDDLEHGGIPYLDYRIYAMKVLFPNQTDHPVLSEMQVDPKVRPNLEKGLASFGQLILNKTFLLLFIRTLESNRYFSMRDRVNVASLIMVTLQNRMEYCTDILKTLLANLIEKSMESRSHPKLLLRRTESVAERMLSSWFTFLLYKFLRECAGEPLFLLYQAIKHQVNKGPVDVITSEARCSLSEEKLIRQSVEYKTMTVYVSMSPQTAYLSGVDPNLQTENIETPVKVLDCDAISQVKEKAIDTIYKSAPYSQRPPVDSLDIEWRVTSTARVLMADRDHTNKTEGYCRRINTLAHYRVPDNASLTLVPKQTSLYDMTMAMNDKHRYETLSHFSFGKTISSTISRPTSPLNESDDGYKYWHLVKHHDNDHKDGERSGKMVSEIYLTRLLATKGTLQRFVDDLFETIFSTARLTSSLPIAIKYMFDFLDDQAHGHGKFMTSIESTLLLLQFSAFYLPHLTVSIRLLPARSQLIN